MLVLLFGCGGGGGGGTGTNSTTTTTTGPTTGGNNATVTGSMSDSNGSLSGVIIEFFSATGAIVKSVQVENGKFSASVPPSAVSFNLESSTINRANDYVEFNYNGVWYSSTISGCNAPLPTLTAGQTVTLTDILIPATSTPPPPPPTC